MTKLDHEKQNRLERARNQGTERAMLEAEPSRERELARVRNHLSKAEQAALEKLEAGLKGNQRGYDRLEIPDKDARFDEFVAKAEALRARAVDAVPGARQGDARDYFRAVVDEAITNLRASKPPPERRPRTSNATSREKRPAKKQRERPLAVRVKRHGARHLAISWPPLPGVPEWEITVRAGERDVATHSCQAGTYGFVITRPKQGDEVRVTGSTAEARYSGTHAVPTPS